MGEDITKPTDTVTRAINEEIFRAKGGPLDTKALERIRQIVLDVNQTIKTEQIFSYEDGNLKFGDTVIDFVKTDASGKEVKQSYTEKISETFTRIVSDVRDEGKSAINNTCDELAKEIGEKIGLKDDALKNFTESKSRGLQQSLQPEIDRAGSQPQSSKAAQAAVSEVKEKTGLNSDNAPKVAPPTPKNVAELLDRAKNPKGIDKVIIDTFTKQIGEKVMKDLQDKVDKINNDANLSDEKKEEAIKNIGEKAVKTLVDNAASKTWGEKLMDFWEGIKIFGEFLKFVAYLGSAILLIIFSYDFVNKWAKSHTGCFMDIKDSSNNLKKTHKVKGLTCSNNYRDEMKNFEDYPDYIKECSTITPTPPPPQGDGCQACNEGIKAGTNDCPCPDNSDSRAVYASQWCDNKYLKSPDASFSHNYYKRYYSWMDAFEEIATIAIEFIPGLLLNAPNPGSFLDKLFQLLEGFGIFALVFVGIYGLLWMAKSFGFIGGGGGKDEKIDIHIDESGKRVETPQTSPQTSPQVVSQAAPQATCATDYSKCTKEELDAINVASVPPERLEEYNNALQDITVSGQDFTIQQAKSSQAAIKASQEAAKAATAKQKADQLAASQKEREQQIEAQKLILQQKQHEVDLQKLITLQSQLQSQLEQKPGQDYASQIKQMEEETELIKKQALLKQAKEQNTSDPQIIAARKLQEQQEATAKKQREQKEKEDAKEAEYLAAKTEFDRKKALEQANQELYEQRARTSEAIRKAKEAEAKARRAAQEATAAAEKERRDIEGKEAVSFNQTPFTGTPPPGSDPLTANVAISQGSEGARLQRAISPVPFRGVGGDTTIPPMNLQNEMGSLLSNQAATASSTQLDTLAAQQSGQNQGRFRARKSIRASRRMIK